MTEPEKKFKLTHELRIVVASLLSLVVILTWAKFFGPKPPTNLPQGNRPTQTAPAISGANAPSSAGSTTTGTPAARGTATTGASGVGVVQAATPPKGDTQERTLVVENDLYRVEFSNRGAVVKSWQLKKYTDDSKPPRILDLVHPDAARQTGG